MVSSQTLLAGRLSQEPGSQHFWYQKYFAGRMVSSQTLFAIRLSQESGSQHFWYQKYFAGRMVSSQTLFAIRLSQDSGSLALLVPGMFRCSTSLSFGGEPHCCSEYGKLVLV